MTDQYWATLPPAALTTEIMSRWKDWRRYFWQSGIGVKADKGRRYYYGLNDLGEASSRIQVGGREGQFLKMVLNNIRPAVKRSLAMISAQAPTAVPVAANSDSEAREQAISAKGFLEHVHREEDTEALDNEVLEIAMCMGEGGRLTIWDATAGEEEAIDEDTGEPAGATGGFINEALTPFDMARDPSWRSRRKWPWIIVRTWENRWEWAAKHHEKREQILAAKNRSIEIDEGFDIRFGATDLVHQGDAIPVYRFFHVDSLAVRGGRAFTCLDNGTWLEDGASPYSGLPVGLVSPGPIIATSMGYSDVFDALGISDALNGIHSVITTHTTRWGTRPIVDIQGSGLQHSTLGNGASVLTVKSKDHLPTPLDVPPIPADVFSHLETLKEEIFEKLGMNSTAMGEPPFAGMPAQLAAILDQKAREYHEGLASSFNAYKADCASREVDILKKFADAPIMATIQGKAKQWMLQAFTKKDFAHVKRIAMEAAPPGTGTMAFKFSMMEMLKAFGVELPPKDLINLMRTGEYESAFEADEANELRIKSENEALQAGRVPPLLMARTHWIDIPEHLTLLSSPDVTERPEVVKAVLFTVMQKMDLWRSMPPDMLAMLGGPPPPMPVVAMAPEEDPGEPDGGAAPPAAPAPPLGPMPQPSPQSPGGPA